MRRFYAIFRKEFIHIRRDTRSLGIIFLMPVLMTLIFGYAVRLDLQNIPMAVFDADQSRAGRELVARFEQSGYFQVSETLPTQADADKIFNERRAQVILSIPDGFEAGLENASPVPVQFITDASDANSATIAGQYAEQIVTLYVLSNLPAGNSRPGISPLILFNPELDSTVFIVPGIIAIIFIMVCALLTSVAIVREKETGTLEQILVSPIRPAEIILGKVLPYLLLALVLGVMVILFAMYWFHVPFRGNPLALFAFALLYILCSLSLGILISTRAHTMQIALMVALISTMLPSVMLSGFMFPIASMPPIIQKITHIVPARYFLVIIRGIMLKNVNLAALKFQVGSLVALTVILLTIGITKFKASLE